MEDMIDRLKGASPRPRRAGARRLWLGSGVWAKKTWWQWVPQDIFWGFMHKHILERSHKKIQRDSLPSTTGAQRLTPISGRKYKYRLGLWEKTYFWFRGRNLINYPKNRFLNERWFDSGKVELSLNKIDRKTWKIWSIGWKGLAPARAGQARDVCDWVLASGQKKHDGNESRRIYFGVLCTNISSNVHIKRSSGTHCHQLQEHKD